MKSNNWATEDFLTFFIEDATKSRKVFAIVEGLQDDENFWYQAFYKFTDKKVRLHFPYSEETGEVGKGTFMKFYPFLDSPEFKGQFVICRDSDCEHLYENRYKPYFSLPYLFHTHTYNIESHNCVPHFLEEISREILRKPYPFQAFFERYSEISYPLFVHFLWLKEEVTKLEKEIKTATDEMQIILSKKKILMDSFLTEKALTKILIFDIHVSQLADIELFHALFEQKIAEKCAQIHKTLIDEQIFTENQIKAFLQNKEKELNEHISPQNTHYYWNGHIIFDKLLMPLFVQVSNE